MQVRRNAPRQFDVRLQRFRYKTHHVWPVVYESLIFHFPELARALETCFFAVFQSAPETHDGPLGIGNGLLRADKYSTNSLAVCVTGSNDNTPFECR